MKLDDLNEIIKNRTPKPEGVYQYFSVLVPIIEINDELHLLFEVRSETLKTQPREICFPGGRMEPDETHLACAVRETCEELNLSSDKINVMGPMDFLVLPYNLILYPFLGFINCKDVGSIPFNKDEVAEIFTVPLEYFLENPPLSHPIEIQSRIDPDFPFHLIQQGADYHWKSGKYPVYFYSYENYVIWGITARIIKNLVELITEE